MIRTCNLPIANPALYHTANSAPLYYVLVLLKPHSFWTLVAPPCCTAAVNYQPPPTSPDRLRDSSYSAAISRRSSSVDFVLRFCAVKRQTSTANYNASRLQPPPQPPTTHSVIDSAGVRVPGRARRLTDHSHPEIIAHRLKCTPENENYCPP